VPAAMLPCCEDPARMRCVAVVLERETEKEILMGTISVCLIFSFSSASSFP